MRGAVFGALLGIAVTLSPSSTQLTYVQRFIVGAVAGAIVGALFVLLERLHGQGRWGYWTFWILMGHLLIALGLVATGHPRLDSISMIFLLACAWGAGLGLGVWFRVRLQGARWRDPI